MLLNLLATRFTSIYFDFLLNFSLLLHDCLLVIVVYFLLPLHSVDLTSSCLQSRFSTQLVFKVGLFAFLTLSRYPLDLSSIVRLRIVIKHSYFLKQS